MSLEMLLRFSEIIGKLKRVRRAGWVSTAGVDNPESVADHSFRCAILAMCIGDMINIDSEKLIRMLLLHDVQEAYTGDFDRKVKRELGCRKVASEQRTAIEAILSSLPVSLRRRYLLLWEEFESQATPEAILAKDIDKIELMFQALEYERDGYDPEKLELFWIDGGGKAKTPLIRNLFRLLSDKRDLERDQARTTSGE